MGTEEGGNWEKIASVGWKNWEKLVCSRSGLSDSRKKKKKRKEMQKACFTCATLLFHSFQLEQEREKSKQITQHCVSNKGESVGGGEGSKEKGEAARSKWYG